MSIPSNPIRVGVIGLGFMGQTHLRAYAAANLSGRACEVVAVCDRRPERLAGRAGAAGNIATGADRPAFDPARVRAFSDPIELIERAEVDLVSICTHTDTHADLAVAALQAGRHVLIEKPVAIAMEPVRRVADVATHSNGIAMPAMCVRFWPGWDWLKARVEDGRYGSLRSLTFQRLAAHPQWASHFYADTARTGGALFDLHIHDADLILWLLGRPDRVHATGSINHLTTIYHYDAGPDHVVAEGGWDHSPGFRFRMRYVAVFDDVTADFDILRPDPLIVSAGGSEQSVALEPITGYDAEIRHLLDVIAGRADGPRATLKDALNVTALLEAERESLATGRSVALEG